MSSGYEVVIGLEVHVELGTSTKIFCGCAPVFGAPPNTHICPVCLGLPGALPVLNQRALQLALRAALALNCRIAEQTKFDRKNYFYPDLPKAFQISQYDRPLGNQGTVVVDTPEGERRIGITRVHMEEDAGKLLHQGEGGRIGTAESSLVDYNRAGIPLIEIVSEPDLRSADEAYAYLAALKEILRFAGISDCNMEEGRLRCDANISIRPQGQTRLGTKVEIKNINSFKHVRAALVYEAQRQSEALRGKEEIVQETRWWDPDRGMTYPMRGKEEAHDYRYFPEPDLPEMRIDAKMQDAERAGLPELPRAKRLRWIQAYDLSAYDVGVLTAAPDLAEYFEKALQAAGASAAPALVKLVCNWLTVELAGRLNAENRSIQDSRISAPQLAALAALIESGKISGKIGKQVFSAMYNSGKDPERIIQEQGLSAITDTQAIEQLVDKVLNAHPGPVAEYRAGKTQTLGFLVGQVMKASGGQAHPQVVNRILKQRLN